MTVQDHPQEADLAQLRSGNQPDDFDPYPAYRVLRSRAPVWESPWGDFYVSTFAAVSEALRNDVCRREGPPGHATSAKDAIGLAANAAQAFRDWLIFLDPPEHTRLRQKMLAQFSARKVGALKPLIVEVIDDLGRAVAGSEPFDFVEAVARPLPVAVIAAVLGIPRADSTRVLEWATLLRRVLDSGIAEEDTESSEAIAAMQDYFLSLVRDPAWRKTEAGAAFASLWEAYPTEVAAANLAMLAFAGHETTVHLLGSLAMHLGGRPAVWTSVAENAGLAAAAVGEVLRLESPIQKICRWAGSDVTIGGFPVPANGLMVLLIGSANRDPKQFPNADEFDIHRPADQIAFGSGRHLCLGKSLALLEATTLLEILPKRWPEITVVDTAFEWLNNASFRGLRKLTLRRQAN